jgi:hypothetical protein
MKKFLSLAIAGLFLLGLPDPGWAQKEVEPPAVPPMLEGPRPLEHPDTREATPPPKVERKKAKPKAKLGGKRGKVRQRNKKAGQKPPQVAKKKGPKTAKKKPQAQGE